jgi:hypothetical protein
MGKKKVFAATRTLGSPRDIIPAISASVAI